jgi:hypothetical protein
MDRAARSPNTRSGLGPSFSNTRSGLGPSFSTSLHEAVDEGLGVLLEDRIDLVEDVVQLLRDGLCVRGLLDERLRFGVSLPVFLGLLVLERRNRRAFLEGAGFAARDRGL